jgi:acetolactate synthase-1/2/3 large subunit
MEPNMTSCKADSFHSNSSDTPMNGGEIVLQALCDTVSKSSAIPAQPSIYDEIFQQGDIKHYLVRHEQGAGHAAEAMRARPGRSAS